MNSDEPLRCIQEEQRDFYLKLTTENASSMTYFKRRWDENRGDEYAGWGCSDYYFEVIPDGTVIRQMEIYDSGVVLQYHPDHLTDTFGFLTDQSIDLSEFAPFSISRQEFEAAWASHQPLNR